MSTVSTLEVAYSSHDTPEQPLSALARTEVSSGVPQGSTASSVEQRSEHLERTISRATSSTERDSGYASTATSLSQRTSFRVSGSSTDGIALPERRLLPRKITHLKVFDTAITQSTQNRFKDLSELFNKRLYDLLNEGTKTGIGDISIKLKILWESETTAQPWVVIQCKKDAEKKVKKFFNQRDVLSEYQPPEADISFPSFKILVRALPPARRAATNYTDIYTCKYQDTPYPPTLCGMIIKANQPDGNCIATVGGLIKVTMVDTEFILYGMTAGHIVHQEASKEAISEYEDCNDREGSGSENGYFSNPDDYSDINEDEDIQLDLPFDEEQMGDMATMTAEVTEAEKLNISNSTSWSKIGHISLASQDTQNERNFDWTLIEIEDSFFYTRNLPFIPDNFWCIWRSLTCKRTDHTLG